MPAETEKQIAEGVAAMSKPYNENLKQTIKLAQEMMALADEGDMERNDSNCAILYGFMRDMAYKLRRMAEEECDRHKNVGKWD